MRPNLPPLQAACTTQEKMIEATAFENKRQFSKTLDGAFVQQPMRTQFGLVLMAKLLWSVANCALTFWLACISPPGVVHTMLDLVDFLSLIFLTDFSERRNRNGSQSCGGSSDNSTFKSWITVPSHVDLCYRFRCCVMKTTVPFVMMSMINHLIKSFSFGTLQQEDMMNLSTSLQSRVSQHWEIVNWILTHDPGKAGMLWASPIVVGCIIAAMQFAHKTENIVELVTTIHFNCFVMNTNEPGPAHVPCHVG